MSICKPASPIASVSSACSCEFTISRGDRKATNTPRGAKTAATYEGLFKELRINRGFQMPHPDEGQ
jgi:hypothetical protein